MRHRAAVRVTTALLLISAFGGGVAHALELTINVDNGKKPLADAVVSVHSPAAALLATPVKGAIMDQRKMMFTPTVLPITVGTLVRFPNSDNIRHHVYSFSPAKRFELPLYAGVQAEPVLFDKPGVVTLGCNIHDWMVGYIVVLDTPYFAKTGKDGRVRLELPAGAYQLRVWHPQLIGGAQEEALDISAEGPPLIRAVHLSLAPDPPRSPEERMREAMKKKNRSHPYH